MNRKYLLQCGLSCSLCFALIGCGIMSSDKSAQQSLPVTKVPVTPPVLPPVNMNDDMLGYYLLVRQMPAQDLQKKLQDLNTQADSPKRNLQKAIIFGLMRGTVDLNRALALLDAILKSDDVAAQALKPLASLLHASYSEWRRLDDALEKQALQTKEVQRRADLLNQKLDELKNIEHLLPTRPRNSNESH